MSRRRYEIHATIAQWVDTAGRKCKRTAMIGTVFESTNGKLSMKLDLLPIFPGWSGFASLRDIVEPTGEPPRLPKGRKCSPGMPPPAPPQPDAPPDDKPF